MLTEIVALNTSAMTFYTPWFPKGEDNAVFTLEKVLDTINGGATFTVLTKNREAEGSEGTSAGSFSALTAPFYEAKCTDLEDLVRFKVTFTASAAGQGVIFRFLQPTWYDTAV
ncbi:MAG: hypothetical protein U1F36_11040 [Planctomycetota bacterium]